MPNVKVVVQTPVLATTTVVEPKDLQTEVAGGIGNIVVAGGSGSSGIQHNQTTPSASWNITHSLGRIPNVQIYVGGKVVIVDIDATTTNVFVTFASAQSGVAVLT